MSAKPTKDLLPGLNVALLMARDAKGGDIFTALSQVISEVQALPDAVIPDTVMGEDITMHRRVAYNALEVLVGITASPELAELMDIPTVKRIADALKDALFYDRNTGKHMLAEKPADSMQAQVREWLASNGAKENSRLTIERDDLKAERAELKAEIERLKKPAVDSLKDVPYLIELMREDADGGTAITVPKLEKAANMLEQLYDQANNQIMVARINDKAQAALTSAACFIESGLERGYIRMPEGNIIGPTNRMLPDIMEALAEFRAYNPQPSLSLDAVSKNWIEGSLLSVESIQSLLTLKSKEATDYVKLANWIYGTEVSPAIFMPYDWRGACRSAQLFSTFLHVLFSTMVEDQNLQFVEIEGDGSFITLELDQFNEHMLKQTFMKHIGKELPDSPYEIHCDVGRFIAHVDGFHKK